MSDGLDVVPVSNRVRSEALIEDCVMFVYMDVDCWTIDYVGVDYKRFDYKGVDFVILGYKNDESEKLGGYVNMDFVTLEYLEVYWWSNANVD